jgi:hypothetical protein
MDLKVYVWRYLPNPFACAPGEPTISVCTKYQLWLEGEHPAIERAEYDRWQDVMKRKEDYGQYSYAAAQRMVELLAHSDRYRTWVRANRKRLLQATYDYQGGATPGERTHVDVFIDHLKRLEDTND